MRISGIGYQFRHRQLREWFARDGLDREGRPNSPAALFLVTYDAVPITGAYMLAGGFNMVGA